MEPRKDLFTKAALEKLSSPEQLDVLMQVTKPMGWIGLATTGFLLAMGVAWGIFGSIPIRVDGKGILIIGGSLIDVEAGSAGRISEILVKPGDVVEAGSTIATVGQSKLIEELDNERAALEDLMNKDVRDSANDVATLQLKLDALDKEAKSRQTQIAEMQGQIRSYRQQVETRRASFAQGLTTQATVVAAEAQLTQALNAEKEVRTRVESIPAERAQAKQASEAAASSRKNLIAEAERRIKTLEGQLVSSSMIISTHAGRVVEMMVDRGELVSPQTRVVSLEPLNAKLTGILYVASGEGKKAGTTMEVRLSPSTVKAEE